MFNTAQVVERIVSRSPFLQEAIHEGLINVSSLARKIQPEVEEILKKEIKSGAIVMALNRLELDKHHGIQTHLKNYIQKLGDLVLKSKLILYTFLNSPTLVQHQIDFMNKLKKEENVFYTYCQGVSEQTLLLSEEYAQLLESHFMEERLISCNPGLSAIMIKLAKGSTQISGIYYYILKQLAWENIPLVEVLSTTNELCLVMKDQYVEQSFSLLMGMQR